MSRGLRYAVLRPNNSFKPNPLRGSRLKPESLGRVGLIQVLGITMKDLSRQPSKAEQWLAASLAFIATAAFGAISFALWLYGQSHLATGIFIVFAVASGLLFFRIVRSVPRALSSGEANALAWVFVVLGIGAVTIAIFASGSSVHRLMALGSGLSLLGSGLGIRWLRKP